MKTSEARLPKVSLLDVDVLIALIDPDHLPDHRKRLPADHEQSRLPIPGLTVKGVREILSELVNVEGHRF